MAWRLFNWPFITNLIIFTIILIYSRYLDINYTNKKKPISEKHNIIILMFGGILLSIYLIQFSYIINTIVRGGLQDKHELFDWVIQLFVSNILSFAVIYLGIEMMYPGQFIDSHQIEKSLLTHYIEMIYFSASTFFTIGFGNVVAVGKLSRILNLLQIFTSYIVQTYIYADILLGP